jgi:hypothetical protein
VCAVRTDLVIVPRYFPSRTRPPLRLALIISSGVLSDPPLRYPRSSITFCTMRIILKASFNRYKRERKSARASATDANKPETPLTGQPSSSDASSWGPNVHEKREERKTAALGSESFLIACSVDEVPSPSSSTKMVRGSSKCFRWAS